MTTEVLVKKLSNTITNELSDYGRSSVYTVFDDMIHIMAITISNNMAYFDDGKEAEYFKYLDMYGKDWMTGVSHVMAEIINYFAMGNRDDLLGKLFHHMELHNKHKGQFFTPYEVSLLMARINASTIPDVISSKGFVKMSEPTCGSGGMVIALAQVIGEMGYDLQKQMFVMAQDIDPRAVRMAYIQLSCCGVPSVVNQGNTLTNEVLHSWYTPAFIQYDWNKRLDGKHERRNRFF